MGKGCIDNNKNTEKNVKLFFITINTNNFFLL